MSPNAGRRSEGSAALLAETAGGIVGCLQWLGSFLLLCPACRGEAAGLSRGGELWRQRLGRFSPGVPGHHWLSKERRQLDRSGA